MLVCPVLPFLSPPPWECMRHCICGTSLSCFKIQTRHKLPYNMIATAHKFEQVLRDGFPKLINLRMREVKPPLVNIQDMTKRKAI